MRPLPPALVSGVSVTADGAPGLWKDCLSNARMIENGGPRDLCANDTYTGDRLGHALVSGTWDARTNAGKATDTLLVMTQKDRTQPFQVGVSVKNGQLRSGGARMRVVEPAASVQYGG